MPSSCIWFPRLSSLDFILKFYSEGFIKPKNKFLIFLCAVSALLLLYQKAQKLLLRDFHRSARRRRRPTTRAGVFSESSDALERATISCYFSFFFSSKMDL